MIPAGKSLNEQALAWLVRVNDPDFEDWHVFMAWLESDPANADEYHRLADSELAMRPLVEQAGLPAPVVPPNSGPLWRHAIAAGLAVLAAAGATVIVPRLSPIPYSTEPGEQRTIALGGSDRILMNGATRLQLAGLDRRTVKLEKGEILLRLHDAGRGEVKVLSGDLELVDIGTIFDVVRDGTLTSVVVSEGAVVADPGGAKVELRRGDRLDARDGDRTLRTTPADAAAVGAWTAGQLVYRSESVDRVISDLRRTTGIDFALQPDMGPRQFTGTLAVAEVRRDPQVLAPLLGVDIRRSGKRWIIGGGTQD